MRYSKLLPGPVLFVLLSLSLLAATATLTGDGIASTKTITNAASGLGAFDGNAATIGNWRNGDTATLTVSGSPPSESIESVQFAIRMRAATGSFSNDNIAIQYSNDSGASWITSQSGIQVPSSFTTYGNYTVTGSFTTAATLDGMQVRILYTQNSGPDGPTIGIDGVEVYVSYSPPDTSAPLVTLNAPSDGAFVANRTVGFSFTPSDEGILAGCTLLINGAPNETNSTPLSSGTANLITATFAVDGDQLWNVNCTDEAANAGTAPVSRIVKIDTSAPTVQLEEPLDGYISGSSEILFRYNVSDAASISNCELIVGGEVKNTDSTITRDATQELSASLANGNYLWSVSCTDENGWEGQGSARNISVQVLTPTIVASEGSYEQGQIVPYSGENWQGGANVSVSLALSNGTLEAFSAIANGSGQIAIQRQVGYGHPLGTSLVNARQANDSGYNASTSFTITQRPVAVWASENSYVQGGDATIRGTGFSPNTQVDLTIEGLGESNQTNITANATGGVFYVHPVGFSDQAGLRNVTATDLAFPNLNATANFTVTPRVPVVQANMTSYLADENVGISGSLFSSLSTIIVQVYNTLTGQIGPQFPASVMSGSEGGFSYAWYTGNTCSGNYTILAEDQNETALKANTTFLIDQQGSYGFAQAAQSVRGNLNAAPQLADVNASDGAREVVGLGSALTGYLEFGFFPGLPANASYSSINVSVEHLRTSSKVTGYQFFTVWQGIATVVSGPGCSGTPTDALSTAVCDVASAVANSTVANNLTVRVEYTRSGGGPGDAEIDFAVADYGWTGDERGCFEFGGSPIPPSLLNMNTPERVVLNAGTTKRLECNFTVSDGNGADEILGANVTVFTSPSGALGPDDNRSHYTNSSCLLAGQGLNSKDFSCTVDLLYYARNGTWTCNATGISVDGTSSTARTFAVDPLYAIGIDSPLLDFGEVETGVASKEVAESISNIGNRNVTINVLGYASALGDGFGFVCANESIGVEQVRFSDQPAPYVQKSSLSSSFQDTGLVIGSQVNETLQEKVSYWQASVPKDFPGTGSCTGVVVFHAEAG